MKTLLYAVFVLFTTDLLNAQNLDWAKSMGLSGSTVEGKDIAIDSQNSVYSIGKFANTVDFDPGAGVSNLTSSTEALYVQKLDAGGNFLWARAITSTGYVSGYCSISADASNNVYIITQYTGTIDCDPGSGTVSYSSPSSNSTVIVKLNATGDLVYAKHIVGFMPMSVFVSNNFVYLSGIYQAGTIDFDVNAGTSNYTSAAGGGFVQKLDLSWNMIWTKTFEGLVWPPAIDTDSNGNLLAGGRFTGTVDFDPGSGVSSLSADASLGSTINDVYLFKLSASGTLIWVKHITSPGTEDLLSLAVDKNSNEFFIGGNRNSSSDLDPSAAVAVIPGAGAYVAKFDGNGAYLWGKHINNQLTGVISADPAGNVVIVDKFQFAFDADPGPGTFTLNAVGSFDVYILKLNGNGNYVWAGVTGGSGFDTAYGLHRLDNDGNIYYTGRFESAADFDPMAGTSYLSSQGIHDAFVSKINGCAHNAPDICLVTVDSLANNNVIYWDKLLYLSADSFIVYRYDAFSTNYLRIGAVAASDTNNFLVDTARTVGGPNGGDPQYSSYRYKMAIRDICGTTGTRGLYHESIFIQQNFQNFSWNAYGIEGQSSPASGYQFLRDNNGTGSWTVLVNTGGLSTTDPNYASYPAGKWRVDALGFSCTTGTSRMVNGVAQQVMGAINTSRSNIKSPTSIGLQELQQPIPVKVFPNPAADLLNIEFPSIADETSIEISNVLGEVMYAQKTRQLKNTFDCSSLHSGVYFITIHSAKGHAVRKVVIE